MGVKTTIDIVPFHLCHYSENNEMYGNSLIDFFLLSHSVYGRPSGFSYQCAKIYDIEFISC